MLPGRAGELSWVTSEAPHRVVRVDYAGKGDKGGFAGKGDKGAPGKGDFAGKGGFGRGAGNRGLTQDQTVDLRPDRIHGHLWTSSAANATHRPPLQSRESRTAM